MLLIAKKTYVFYILYLPIVIYNRLNYIIDNILKLIIRLI